MCIGLWSVEHPDYALILCTNRDEYLNRPTQKAHFHSFASSLEDDSLGPILSGRDIQAGGSWFGINTIGRVALLTNITEPSSPDGYSTSRGSLVSSFLLSTHPLRDESGTTVQQDANYAGFNLLLLEPVPIETPTTWIGLASTSGGAGPGMTVTVPESAGAPGKRTLNPQRSPPPSSDPPTCTIIGAPKIQYNSLFVTNHGGGRQLISRSLIPSEKYCGCMSNSIDSADRDRWPKVIRATADFEALLRCFTPMSNNQTSEAALVEQLFGVLAWHPEEPIKSREDAHTTVQVLPIPAVFDGQSTYYGTRLTTVLLVRRDGQVLFIERDIWELGPHGEPFKADPPRERTFRFTINVDDLSRL